MSEKEENRNSTVLIIDYGAGNTQSIKFALQRLGFAGVLSSDPQEIQAAAKVIFPGVGEAGTAMKKLQATGLDQLIPELTQPVLGICLGLQLMCAFSEEGNTRGLDIFKIEVRKFGPALKVPQIGWNQIDGMRTELFHGIEEKEYIFMIHSYFASLCKDTIATADYGIRYSAALNKDNFYGLQFHPEKSGSAGERILKNFLNL